MDAPGVSTEHMVHRVPCSDVIAAGLGWRRGEHRCGHASVLLGDRQRPCRLLRPGAGRDGDIDRDLAALRGYGIGALLTLTETPLPWGALERHGIASLHPRSTTSTRPRQRRCSTRLPSSTRPAPPALVAVHCLAGRAHRDGAGRLLDPRRALLGEAIAAVRAICPGAIEASPQTSALTGWAAERPWLI